MAEQLILLDRIASFNRFSCISEFRIIICAKSITSFKSVECWNINYIVYNSYIISLFHRIESNLATCFLMKHIESSTFTWDMPGK